MIVRRFAQSDLAAILAVQSKCPEASQWREEDYSKLAIDPLGTLLVAEVSGRLAGFAAFHRAFDEAEVLNLAVDPVHRRKGIARALLTAGIEILRAHEVERIFLEVRASNQAAIDFYSASGFRLQRKRRDYYNNPAEDALVLELNLESGA
jgi:ribosomal-protein-alanine N-acetyltransferase